MKDNLLMDWLTDGVGKFTQMEHITLDNGKTQYGMDKVNMLNLMENQCSGGNSKRGDLLDENKSSSRSTRGFMNLPFLYAGNKSFKN